jgi:hypothetical protein
LRFKTKAIGAKLFTKLLMTLFQLAPQTPFQDKQLIGFKDDACCDHKLVMTMHSAEAVDMQTPQTSASLSPEL